MHFLFVDFVSFNKYVPYFWDVTKNPTTFKQTITICEFQLLRLCVTRIFAIIAEFTLAVVVHVKNIHICSLPVSVKSLLLRKNKETKVNSNSNTGLKEKFM